MNYWVMPGLRKSPSNIMKSMILKAVCEVYGIRNEQLTQAKKRNRTRLVSDARTTAYRLLRDLHDNGHKAFTLTEIGKMFNLHHTTVVNGLKKSDELYKYEHGFRDKLEQIKNLIKTV